MNTLDGNVISFRPDDNESQRWLALSIGNGARLTDESLGDVVAATAGLLRTCQNLTGLASDADTLTDEFEFLAQRLERCMALSHQLAQL